MSTPIEPQISVCATADELIVAVAEKLAKLAEQAIAERGCFIWSLAGGSTPGKLYRLLATDKWRTRFEWDSIIILFGDERAVPPSDARSNYRMAREAFLDAVKIPKDNVYRMRGEEADLNGAARDYGLKIKALDCAVDLALLGMGPDGHTASLFPHTPALQEAKHRCVAADAPPLEPQVPRLTLTFPVFNNARQVWVLVTGADKAERLHKVLAGPRDTEEQPIQGIAPQSGKLIWWLDSAAAQLLLEAKATD